MDAILAARGARAIAALRTTCVLAVAAAILPLAGCSSSGGSSVLFPNDHQLMKSARYIAETSRPGGPRELAKQPLEAFYIQPGDVLLLEVTDLEADIRLPADQTVMPDGTIDLGEYGRVVVAGLTVEQIEILVHSAVQQVEKNQKVKPINVRLNVAESAVYYVLGEVNAPGAYPLIGRETVLDAILTAGGLSDRASEEKVILSRPTPPPSCRIVLPVCYNRIVQLGDTTTNYQIRPGDRVFVGTRACTEALMFWRSGTSTCPDCATGCNYPVAPYESPFIGMTGPVPPPCETVVLPQAEPSTLPMPSPDVVPAIPEPTLEPTPEPTALRLLEPKHSGFRLNPFR